jgi:hypothetical protein
VTRGNLPPAEKYSDAPGRERVGIVLFAILFAAYGYFHQGGGWNQNSRFDQVRAIVENHQLEINNFFLYRAQSSAAGTLEITRLPPPGNLDLTSIPPFANTFDVAIVAGKVYPNKPPGTVFLVVPAYWVIFTIESALGIDPDSWWTQTLNFHLSTVFSVGLLTALGGAVFYLVLLRLFPTLPGWCHVATTLIYGLGTLVFPFATLLFDHGLLATISLGVFALLFIEDQGGFSGFRSGLSYFLAGILCGVSIVVNYSAILLVACLFVYGLWTAKNRWGYIPFGVVGFALPMLLLLWYHLVCFGDPFATANTHQFGMFQTEDAVLFGMLALPKLDIAYQLLFSIYRGLFFTSPVLLIALLGTAIAIYGGSRRREAILVASVFVVQLLLNSAFNGWHAGWSFGPRYLIPVLPFLCLMLAPMFHRLPRLTGGLAIVSIALMLTATAVDPQVPIAVANPVKDHILKLAMGERLSMNGIFFESPVSANPIGIYETWGYPANFVAPVARQWHSFNLGEFFWPGSWWSLSPLLFLIGMGFFSVVRPRNFGYFSRPFDGSET